MICASDRHMKTENAIRAALIMSNKFDLPEILIVRGRDQFGKPIEVTIPAVDAEALEAEVRRLMAV